MSRTSSHREHRRCPVDYTCPYIDTAVSTVEGAIGQGLDHGVAWEILQQLEELREMNDTLRIWGVEEAKRVDLLQRQVENA